MSAPQSKYRGTRVALILSLDLRCIPPSRVIMAEVLAVGAAATQLLHHGYLLTSTATALTYSIYQAPERIEEWTNQSSTMLSILDNLRASIAHVDQAMLVLVEKCRCDIIAICNLLYPFSTQEPARRNSFRVQQAYFVVRRNSEINRRMKTFRQTFSTMTLSLILSVSCRRQSCRY